LPICDGEDHSTTLNETNRGAGRFPTSYPFSIRGFGVFSQNPDPYAYVVVGIAGGNGDWMSDFLVGPGDKTLWLPTPYVMHDNTYEIHLHNMTSAPPEGRAPTTGDGHIGATLFYTSAGYGGARLLSYLALRRLRTAAAQGRSNPSATTTRC
jgi:hypothetical protein